MRRTTLVLICILCFTLGVAGTLVVVNKVAEIRMNTLCVQLGGVPAKGNGGIPECIFSKNMV